MDKNKTTRATRTSFGNITFASAFEAQVAEYLSSIGAEWTYEPIRLPWIPKLRLYVPDFYVKLPNGESFYLEAKGYFDPQARVKMGQIKKQYPDLDIRMFFMNDSVKIPPAKTTTYADWAKKTGYEYYTFSKDIVVEHNNKKRTVQRNSSASSSNGQCDKKVRKTSKRGAQSDSSSGRSRRTKTGSIQKESSAKSNSSRSSRRSVHSGKDGGR